MISHKHKFIFIHIPKCAGSSIRDFYFDTPNLDWKVPNYDLLYGWCPKRKIHLQHATPKQLVETGLISKGIWDSYFKFAFVRNPWDRAYSDYLWIQKDSRVKGSFKNYINGQEEFNSVMNDNTNMNYRGDHLTTQVEYVSHYNAKLDFIGRFENLYSDIKEINEIIGLNKSFEIHEKRNTKKLDHYSKFYSESNKKRVNQKFKEDIELLNYSFEDYRKGLNFIKKFL